MSLDRAVALTAVFRAAADGGYVAFVAEIRGANTQGDTLEEARANLRETALLVLDSNRSLIEAELADADVIREALYLLA